MVTCKTLLHCLTLFLFLTSACAQTQDINDSRWWAGIKSGMTFTSAHPSAQYSAFGYITPVANTSNQYASIFKGKGPLIAITIDYSITRFLALSFQPAIQSYWFSYASQYSWKDTADQRTALTNTSRQRMQYLELPLLLKAGFSMQSFRIFVQGGAFYGKRIHATKNVTSQERLYDTTSAILMNQFTENFDLSKQYISSQIGIIAGGGISFDVNYFRLALECNFRYGLNNITNVKNRYIDHRMVSGVYDVPDDIKLRNLEVVLHCSTPLDYLMHMPGFSAKPVRRK